MVDENTLLYYNEEKHLEEKMGLSSRIQKLRINNGLTQEQLAEMLSISRQSVSKWEMDQSLPEIDKQILILR